MPPERVRAFAPGRVNLIGEHTDYNEGLALPFAIARASPSSPTPSRRRARHGRIYAYARDLGERDGVRSRRPPARQRMARVRPRRRRRARARRPPARRREPRVRRRAATRRRPVLLRGARGRAVPRADRPRRARPPASTAAGRTTAAASARSSERIDIARLCARVENDWVGAHTGLLDQLASLYGEPDAALCIDFRTLDIQPVPLLLGDWTLVVLDSGERHQLASSGYNQRRAECARACQLLGVPSLRDAEADVGTLEHCPSRCVAARCTSSPRTSASATLCRAARRRPPRPRPLLDASHRSLRDDYEVSTPAVEATVQRLRDAGASGARLVGGGFGGSVLGLFAPVSAPPPDAREVHPGPGAHLLDGGCISS